MQLGLNKPQHNPSDSPAVFFDVWVDDGDQLPLGCLLTTYSDAFLARTNRIRPMAARPQGLPRACPVVQSAKDAR